MELTTTTSKNVGILQFISFTEAGNVCGNEEQFNGVNKTMGRSAGGHCSGNCEASGSVSVGQPAGKGSVGCHGRQVLRFLRIISALLMTSAAGKAELTAPVWRCRLESSVGSPG